MCKKEDFIGSTFDTPKGGILTVMAVLNKQPNTVYKPLTYLCECSLCSKDKELFTKNFKGTKRSIINGTCPCGCSGHYSYSEAQYEIRVKRKCKEVNYVFLGFYEDWKASRTKIKLSCNTCNHEWNTTNIGNFLRGSAGCPKCAKVSASSLLSRSDADTIKEFKKNEHFVLWKFYKNIKYNSKYQTYPYWNCICPLCSNDIFVEAGLCSGVFISTKDRLKIGRVPCRCSKRYVYSREQMEFKLKLICNSEGLTFLGWKDDIYKNTKSKFVWLCSKGHLCEGTVARDFINIGTRCKTCDKQSSTRNGYFPTRTDEKDFLYLFDFKIPIKVGRSFNIEERRTNLRREAGLYENQRYYKYIQLLTK